MPTSDYTRRQLEYDRFLIALLADEPYNARYNIVCFSLKEVLSMYKTALIRRVAKETRLSHRIVDDVVSESLEAITQALRDGQTAVLPGFGTFYTKERKAGTVRHIRTGEPLAIPAMRQADFRVGELLRRAVRKAPRQRSRRTTGIGEAEA